MKFALGMNYTKTANNMIVLAVLAMLFLAFLPAIAKATGDLIDYLYKRKMEKAESEQCKYKAT